MHHRKFILPVKARLKGVKRKEKKYIESKYKMYRWKHSYEMHGYEFFNNLSLSLLRIFEYNREREKEKKLILFEYFADLIEESKIKFTKS